jgi:hypothetical protein
MKWLAELLSPFDMADVADVFVLVVVVVGFVIGFAVSR